MATKLYFHDATNGLTGTFPSGEQSAQAPDWSATGAGTLRTMDTTIGAAQASLSGSSLGSTAAQKSFLGMFCSIPLLGSQTVGGGTITFNAAEEESNTNMNFWINNIEVYVWRPSTGAKIGTVKAAGATSMGGTEPTSQNNEQVSHWTTTSTGIAAQDGDVIIVEVWGYQTSQGMGSSYNGFFYYDGTTENTTENASVSNHASFIQFTENLSFQPTYKPVGYGFIIGA